MKGLIAGVSAYLLDRAITLGPNEMPFALNETPKFTNGRRLNNLTKWKVGDLLDLSCLFVDRDYRRAIKEGYRGAGTKKTKSGEYTIILYADNRVCEIFESKLSKLNQKSQHMIQIDRLYNAEFAQPMSKCYGGTCILQPTGTLNGVLGAWLRRNNPNNIPVGITNNHVAVEFNKYGPGTPIRNKKKVRIGEVENFIPLIKNTSKYDCNYVDLAWIRPSSSISIDYELGCSQNRVLPMDEFDLIDYYHNSDDPPTVFLCNETGKKSVVIDGPQKTFYIGQNMDYRFVDVVRLIGGQKGDSGSIVIDEYDRIGGLFFATSSFNGGNFGYAARWEHVRDESKIDFIY